jgi:protein TonB
MKDIFRQAEHDKLLPVLLVISALAHLILAPISLSWLFGEESPQLQCQKSGQNTVSVQLVAFRPQPPAPPVFEAFNPLPIESEPVEVSPPPETETQYQKQIQQTPVPVIHHTPDVAIAHAAPVPLASAFRETPEKALPDIRLAKHLEPIEKTVKRQLPQTDTRATVLETQNSVTASSQQSTGAEVPPKLVSRVLPQYPRRLLLRRIEGSVRLLVRIGTNGRARSIQVHQSSGFPEMDAAATEAVQRWEFTPAKRGNIPFEKTVVIPVNFKVRR